MQDIDLLLQPQVKPSPCVCDSPHTQSRRRRALLFTTLDTFLIVLSCRLKGFAKPPRSVYYAMQMRPKKSRNGCPCKHISSEKNGL